MTLFWGNFLHKNAILCVHSVKLLLRIYYLCTPISANGGQKVSIKNCFQGNKPRIYFFEKNDKNKV